MNDILRLMFFSSSPGLISVTAVVGYLAVAIVLAIVITESTP